MASHCFRNKEEIKKYEKRNLKSSPSVRRVDKKRNEQVGFCPTQTTKKMRNGLENKEKLYFFKCIDDEKSVHPLLNYTSPRFIHRFITQ